ncbi:MAG: 3-carboxy-cis,cis-muconate cycloisomerase [Armatimonadota bacterium]
MIDIGTTMFTSPEMAAVFSGPSLIQRMLDFEAALARAEAAAGLIPQTAAEAIASRCRVERFDVPALYQDAPGAGTLAVPLIRMLTGLVEGDARRFVHWGATSQDAIDTAMVLQMRDGLDLLTRRLLDIARTCAGLAEHHRHTPMAGRTLLQHAVPITFGLKAARWLGATTRLLQRVHELRERALVVQFGGAAGTLASLGSEGMRVMELLARELDLAVPDLPWHTERDRVGEIAGVLGTVAATVAKVASDIALLSQTEVGEVSTAAQAGEGRSSTMPQKRNPVEAMAASACARLAIGLVPILLSAGMQEHERAAGGWQAEWEAIPQLFRRTSGAVEWVHRAVRGLEVDADRMRANLDRTHGLIMAEALTMALAAHIGKDEAYQVVQRVCDRAMQVGAELREVAASDERIRAVLLPDQIEHALDVSAYLGSTDAFIDRALDGLLKLDPSQG